MCGLLPPVRLSGWEQALGKPPQYRKQISFILHFFVAAYLEAAEKVKTSLVRLWVDQGFSGENFARVVGQLAQAEVEVICRQSQDFEVLPKRWIVERTFGWWNRYRRLSKDYELLVEMSEAMIYGAMIHTILRRLAKLKQNNS